jgi:hypothetical protein
MEYSRLLCAVPAGVMATEGLSSCARRLLWRLALRHNEQAYNQWRLLNDELPMKYYTTFSKIF